MKEEILTSFQRNIAATVESMAKGHSFDGLVLMPSCDKVVPGMLMGAARVDVPTIVVTGWNHGSRTIQR